MLGEGVVILQSKFVYPFSALMGQDKMKKALLLNAINPRLGGVLIRGEKGTAKSTAVRSLAALLPEIPVIAGCSYQCDPFQPGKRCLDCRENSSGATPPSVRRQVQVVDLPVSATEDRVVGSLDFEFAVKQGGRRFEPGLLARANRGILYVDEVNLLDDHIVDLLLDAAALGINFVEREGLSYSHPAEFILVGTMNPEEGELRPQLIDRFGLCVQVEGESDPAVRVEIIKRRESFDLDPLDFLDRWAEEEARMCRKIVSARDLLPGVIMEPGLEELVTRICTEALVAGHRADLVMTACARTLAAFHGRAAVGEDDVHEAAEYVLPHRMREAPPPQQQPEPPAPEEPDEPDEPENEAEQAQEQEQQPAGAPEMEEESQGEEQEHSQKEAPPQGVSEKVFAVGEPFPVRRISYKVTGVLRRGSGRRSRGRTATKSGRYVRSTLRWEREDLAFDATLRAAAPYQRRRRRDGVAVVIEPGDLREKVREKRVGNFLLFVVDASGSMGAQQRMVEAKGAVLSLLLDAYQKRDRVGLVAFRGEEAEVVLPPTNSVERAQVLLEELPTGGRTPLSAGLVKSYEVARAHLYKDPDIRPLLIVISDGKANVSLGEERPLAEAARAAGMIREEEQIRSLVVDVEKSGFLSFGLARQLAEVMDADYYELDELKADRLVEAVHGVLGG